MDTISKSIMINSTSEMIFTQIDDFSKTGIHINHCQIRIIRLNIDFIKHVIKWYPPKWKVWKTIGNSKIIFLSWYRMLFEISNTKKTIANLSISYLPT